jgi:hypothetical protein
MGRAMSAMQAFYACKSDYEARPSRAHAHMHTLRSVVARSLAAPQGF